MPSDVFQTFTPTRQVPMVQLPPALITGPTVGTTPAMRMPAMPAHVGGGGGGSPLSLLNLMYRMQADNARLDLQRQRLEQGTGKVAEANLKKQAFDNAMLELVQTPGLRQEYDQIMQLPAMVRLKRLKELEKKYVQPVASRIHDENVRSRDMFNALFGGDVAQAESEHERRTSDATAAILPNFLKGAATLGASVMGLLPWTDSREWARWRDEFHKEQDAKTEYGRYQRELANAGVGTWDRAEGLSGMANLIAEQALPVGSFFIPNVGLARLGMGARALMGANAGFGAALGAGLTDLDFNSMINNANIPEEQKQAALRSGARAINTGVGAITGAVAPNFAGAAARIPGLRWAGNVVNRAANISPRLGGAANAALGMAGLTTAQVPVTNWAYQSQTNPYLPPEEQQHDFFAGYGDALRLAALTGGLVGGITGYRPPVPTPIAQPAPTAQPTPQNTTTTPVALPPAESSSTAPTEQNTPLALPMGAIAPPYDIPVAAQGETIVTPYEAPLALPYEIPVAAQGESLVTPYEAPLALPPGRLNNSTPDIPQPPTTGIDTSITPLTPEEQISLTEYLNSLFNTNPETMHDVNSPEPIRDVNSPEAWTDINSPNLDFLPQDNQSSSNLYDTITDLIAPIRRPFINNDVNSPEAWTDINRPNLDFLPQDNINGRTTSNNNQITSGMEANTTGTPAAATDPSATILSSDRQADTSAGPRGEQTSQLGTNEINNANDTATGLNTEASTRRTGGQSPDASTGGTSQRELKRPRAYYKSRLSDEEYQAYGHLDLNFRSFKSSSPETLAMTDAEAFSHFIRNQPLSQELQDIAIAQTIAKSAAQVSPSDTNFLTKEAHSDNVAYQQAINALNGTEFKNDINLQHVPDIKFENILQLYSQGTLPGQHSEFSIKPTSLDDVFVTKGNPRNNKLKSEEAKKVRRIMKWFMDTEPTNRTQYNNSNRPIC